MVVATLLVAGGVDLGGSEGDGMPIERYGWEGWELVFLVGGVFGGS